MAIAYYTSAIFENDMLSKNMLNITSIQNLGLLWIEVHEYLHYRTSRLFFYPAKFDNFKDEKISDYITVSVFWEIL